MTIVPVEIELGVSEAISLRSYLSSYFLHIGYTVHVEYIETTSILRNDRR
jgi:hypothetical protein